MSNSKLATWIWDGVSDHYNVREHTIDKITIHHMAGNLTLEQCCNSVQSRGGSCNYCINTSGIIGVMIDEKYRAWTSSNRDNDMRAVTIEVANDGGEPDWHVSDKAIASLINLCVDICQRNGIKELKFTGDTNGNVTLHKMFAATACPGKYLGDKIPYIVSEVNKKLKTTESVSKPTKVLDNTGFKKNDKSLGVLAFKCLLMVARKQGYIKRKVNCDNKYTSGVEEIVNYFLNKWGYKTNGIAGEKFIKKMTSAILKKIK